MSYLKFKCILDNFLAKTYAGANKYKVYLSMDIALRAVKTNGKRNGEEIYIFHTVQTTIEVSLLCFERL